jgi:hypothetical protein
MNMVSGTLADLIAGASEDRCRNCPPDRVCAWACCQGMGVIDNWISIMRANELAWPIDPGVAFERQALWECYN